MRIAVVGAGGIGGYLGARLLQHGWDVRFLARGATLAALRQTGLAIESPAGDASFPQVVASDDARKLAPVDLVVVAVKAWDVEAALAAAAPLFEGARACVLTTQNGVEPPLAIAERAGRARTIVGLFRLPCFVVAPGRIRHIGGNAISIGTLERGAADARLAELRAALGGQAVVSDDIVTAMWDKMIGMAVTTGVGALARAPLGVLLDVDPVRELVLAAAREAIAVARAHGARLPDDFLDRMFANSKAFSRSTVFSTQRDILHGRPSELDTQIAAIARLGRRAGIATPIFDVISTALLPQEMRARGTLAFECT